MTGGVFPWRRVLRAAIPAHAALFVAVGVFWHRTLLLLGVLPGTPGPTYNWWSGSGSVILPPLITLAGLALMFWYRHICHDPDCLWIGRHSAAGGTFTYCHRHHPDAHPEHGFRDREHRHGLHHEWRAANTAPAGPDPGTVGDETAIPPEMRGR